LLNSFRDEGRGAIRLRRQHNLDHFADKAFFVRRIVSSRQRHNKIVAAKLSLKRFRRRKLPSDKRSRNYCRVFNHLAGADPHIVS
jgi:hypothetical protein